MAVIFFSPPTKYYLDGRQKEDGRAVTSISTLIRSPTVVRAGRHGRPPLHMPASNNGDLWARQADAIASRSGAGAAPTLPAAEGQSEETEGSAIACAGVDPLAAIGRSRRRRPTARKSAGLGEQWGLVCGVSKLMLGFGMCGVELGIAVIVP